jgi:hypothetical protein
MALHPYQKQMYMKAGIIAALIILPIAGFLAGMQYQKQTGGAPSVAQTSGAGRSGGMMRNRAIGTVKSIDSTSITITERQNNTDKTFTLTSSTTYKNGAATTAASDVATGSTVMLTLDSTNNTKVTVVTLNPTFQRPSATTQDSSQGGPAPETMVQ